MAAKRKSNQCVRTLSSFTTFLPVIYPANNPHIIPGAAPTGAANTPPANIPPAIMPILVHFELPQNPFLRNVDRYSSLSPTCFDILSGLIFFLLRLYDASCAPIAIISALSRASRNHPVAASSVGALFPTFHVVQYTSSVRAFVARKLFVDCKSIARCLFASSSSSTVTVGVTIASSSAHSTPAPTTNSPPTFASFRTIPASPDVTPSPTSRASRRTPSFSPSRASELRIATTTTTATTTM